jgi:hypothetical protein
MPKKNIRVDKSTRDRLKTYGSMGDTYDDVLNMLIDAFEDE